MIIYQVDEMRFPNVASDPSPYVEDHPQPFLRIYEDGVTNGQHYIMGQSYVRPNTKSETFRPKEDQ